MSIKHIKFATGDAERSRLHHSRGYRSALAIALLIGGVIAAKAETPWDTVRKSTCGDIVSSHSSPGRELSAFTFTWLAGYLDGWAALSALDPRLKWVGDADINKIGPLLLARCKDKPALPIVEVVAGAFQELIDIQPGAPIALAVPRSR